VTVPVIIVGSINVDLFVHVERLPRPGETVIGGKYSRAHGGKGANQAVAAARLGAVVTFVGMVGDDDLGRDARDELTKEGVTTGALGIAPNHTGVAEILVDERGENLIAVASGANADLTPEAVEKSLGAIDAQKAIVGAVLEIPMTAVEAAARIAIEKGWTFVLNPAPARPLSAELLKRCHLLTPNQHEVAELGARSPEELIKEGADTVVVTRGSSGADLLRPEAPLHHQDAFDVRAVDTTGAGDAFSGALAWALADGRDLERAVELAAAAAALSTQQPGARTGMPSRTELDRFLN
jgi:ribokinase